MSDPVLPEGPPLDDRATVKEGFAFASASFVVNAVVGMLSALLTARVYGVEIIGQYALATAPWLTLIQFSSVAEQVALTKRVAVLPRRHPMVAGHFIPILGFSVLLTFVAGIPIFLLGAAAFRGPIHQPGLVGPALLILGGYVVFENTSWNIDAVLSAFRAGRELFYARLTFVVAFLVLAVGFAEIDKTIWAMAFATVGAFVLSFAARLVLLRRFTRFFPDRASFRQGMRELPEMLLFAVRIVGGRIASGITSQLDTWILGSVASVAVVGAYSRASGIAVRLNDAGYRVNEILFPALVQHYEAGDEPGFERLLMNTMRLTALPIALTVGAAGGASAGILDIFGPGFERGAGALDLLLLATGLAVIGMIFGNALLAVGKPSWATSLAVVRLAVTAAIMYPLARSLGATGAGFAVLVGNLVIAVGGTLMLRRVILTSASTRIFVKTIAVSMVVYAVANVVARAVDLAVPGLVGAVAAMGAGVLAACPLLLLPGGLTRAERESAIGRLRRAR